MSGRTYSNLKVDEFIGKSAHLVVEAERVLSGRLCSEDEVALSFLLAADDDLAIRTLDNVIDIERTTRLDLHGIVRSRYQENSDRWKLTAK